MKSTPFTQKHIDLGAKMAEFAGYNMPISYTGINDEHAAVRNSVGVFDVSHMGEFILKGEHALDLIQRVTTNDASKLTSGKAQYSCLPNKEGGIVDDLLVYCIEENKVYMLPKHLDEQVARLHLSKIGVELEELNKKQADYFGVSQVGPFKPEYYRY